MGLLLRVDLVEEFREITRVDLFGVISLIETVIGFEGIFFARICAGLTERVVFDVEFRVCIRETEAVRTALGVVGREFT